MATPSGRSIKIREIKMPTRQIHLFIFIPLSSAFFCFIIPYLRWPGKKESVAFSFLDILGKVVLE